MYGEVDNVCMCVSHAGGGGGAAHLHRVRHSVLSQFLNLTLDVSGMQHRALCELDFINASSFVSLVFTQ